MDSSESPDTGKPSPRKELQLQGPRPTRLKVSKDSHTIKKSHQPPAQQQTPGPVIIYTVSPKVIHTEPGNFMALVQRLTGAPTTPSSVASSEGPSSVVSSGLSTASQLPAVERTRTLLDVDAAVVGRMGESTVDVVDQLGIGGAGGVDRLENFPRILSPPPSPVSPNLFSPLDVEPPSLGFPDDMNPAVRDGDKSFVEDPTVPSPSNTDFSPQIMSSPGAYWDLFNQF